MESISNISETTSGIKLTILGDVELTKTLGVLS